MSDSNVYAQVQEHLDKQRGIKEKRLMREGVAAERERVFGLSVDEFLIEKLNYRMEKKVICVGEPND